MTRVSTLNPILTGFHMLWTITWKSLAFFTLWAMLYAPFVVPSTGIMENIVRVVPLPTRLYFDLFGAITILLAAWVMVRFVDRRAFVTLGFNPNRVLRDSALGIVFGILWLGVSLAILWLLGFVTPQTSGTFEIAALAIPAIAMLLNTVLQEVLARSYIFQTIQTKRNALWAIFITSLLFTMYHAAAWQNAPLAAVNVFCAGVLFGVAYYRTGNLWLPIAIHFAWNFLLGPVLGLSVSGQDVANHWQLLKIQGSSLLSGGAFGIEGSVIVTVTTLCGIAILWMWYPKRTSSISLFGATVQKAT